MKPSRPSPAGKKAEAPAKKPALAERKAKLAKALKRNIARRKAGQA